MVIFLWVVIDKHYGAFPSWGLVCRRGLRRGRLIFMPASTTSAVRLAGLSTWTVGVKDPSLWTKAFCEQHGLKMTGNKQDLLTR